MQQAQRTIKQTEGDSWTLSSATDSLMDMTDPVEIRIVGYWEGEKGSKTK